MLTTEWLVESLDQDDKGPAIRGTVLAITGISRTSVEQEFKVEEDNL
jgi:hypothetical protein